MVYTNVWGGEGHVYIHEVQITKDIKIRRKKTLS